MWSTRIDRFKTHRNTYLEVTLFDHYIFFHMKKTRSQLGVDPEYKGYCLSYGLNFHGRSLVSPSYSHTQHGPIPGIPSRGEAKGSQRKYNKKGMIVKKFQNRNKKRDRGVAQSRPLRTSE